MESRIPVTSPHALPSTLEAPNAPEDPVDTFLRSFVTFFDSEEPPIDLGTVSEPELPATKLESSPNKLEISVTVPKSLPAALEVSSELEDDPLDAPLSSLTALFENPGLVEEPETSPAAVDIANNMVSLSSAPRSLPLRVISPTFTPGVQPECVLDGGTQIVLMRRDIWQQLDTPILEKRIPMESANSETTTTLRIIENHPVQLGPVTFHLQIHVVEDAPFEVLLGRPFFDVLSCAEISTAGGKHEIRIKNPKDGTPYLFSTKPHFRRTSRFTNHPQDDFPTVVRTSSPCPPPREIAPLFSNAFETVSLSASPKSEYAASGFLDMSL